MRMREGKRGVGGCVTTGVSEVLTVSLPASIREDGESGTSSVVTGESTSTFGAGTTGTSPVGRLESTTSMSKSSTDLSTPLGGVLPHK